TARAMFSRTSAEKSVKSSASGRDAGFGGTKRKRPDQFVASAHRFANRSAIVVDHAALSRRPRRHRSDRKSGGRIAGRAGNGMVPRRKLASSRQIPNEPWAD